jgi:hypothetical protein
MQSEEKSSEKGRMEARKKATRTRNIDQVRTRREGAVDRGDSLLTFGQLLRPTPISAGLLLGEDTDNFNENIVRKGVRGNQRLTVMPSRVLPTSPSLSAFFKGIPLIATDNDYQNAVPSTL